MNKRVVGANKEEKAIGYLKSHGIRIVKQNFRVRQGEIDIVGYDGDTLVFFEVKYRKTKAYGLPEEAVGKVKQRQICRISDFYRCFFKVPDNCQIRYDVVAILGEEITWYRDAFPYCK